MSGTLPIAMLAIMAAGLPLMPAGKLRPLATPASSPVQAGNFTLTVIPATIRFSAGNPATAPMVAANSTATITWSVMSGGSNWNLSVQASASTFSNCPTVPISAVKVSCASATIGSSGGSATCAAPFQLSTVPLQVAGGAEGVLASNYTVTLNFTLADSWRYIAETSPACSLLLTYTANVP